MWKQEIIELLNRSLSQHQFRAPWQYLAERVAGAETFFFGDAEKYDAVMASRSGSVPEPWVHVPYGLTLIEWREPRLFSDPATHDPAPKRAVLVDSQRELGRQTFYSFFYLDAPESQGWIVSPLAAAFSGEGSFVLDWGCLDFHEKVSEEIYNTVLTEANYDFSFARILLEVLNCKNIVTKDVVPPEKLNKKRIKSGKIPLYSYKILEIAKGNVKKKNIDSVQWGYKSPESVRLHHCRGHFKTYVEERPLLGMHTGTYWWEPQVRGDKTIGTIEKEYRVKVKTA